MTSTVVQESETAAMLRLLQVARESGVKLRRDDKGGYWASSASQPGRWHVVTACSCTCPGFGKANRCRHLAALHAHLGWLPGTHPQGPDAEEQAAPLPTMPKFELTYRPGGWVEGDRFEGDTLHYQPEQTRIYVNGVEWVRITGDDTAVFRPGTFRATDLRPLGMHFDTVVKYLREVDHDAPIDQLLADAGLFRANEFHEETMHLAVA